MFAALPQDKDSKVLNLHSHLPEIRITNLLEKVVRVIDFTENLPHLRTLQGPGAPQAQPPDQPPPGVVSADWPLSRKFGCRPDMAMDLLILAKELGLEPYGVSFHVGSQQRDIGAWDAAIASVKVIFERLKSEDNITLKMINMGGGFPANYISRTNDLATYAEEITRFLEEDFGDDMPRIILEPGRSLISNAGILVSEVVLISRKSHTALNRWIFTDVGKFSGLIETLDESIKYPIHVEKTGELEEVIIAGPTCDSADIMYEHYKYGLPLNLAIGDRLYWLSTGAYTTTYSAVEFNGFPPLKSYYI